MSNANQQRSAGGPGIEDKLYRAWKQEQRFYHLRGLSRLMIWAVAMILVDLIVDWQIFFRARVSGSPALLLLVLNIGVLGWVLWHEWLRYLKRYDPVRVSLEVEGKHPELLSVLVSYTQLQGPAVESSHASPALLDAMRGQAVSRTRPLDFREVVDFRQLRNLLIVAICSVAFFSAISFTWTGHMRSLFLRLIGVVAPYPTQTQILAVTGDLTIKEGESIEISAEADGKIPETGRLFVRFESDTSWEPLILSRGDANEFVREIPEVYEGLSYYIRIGDAVSDEHTVSVSPAPEILQSKIFLTYPTYMAAGGIADPPVEDLNLSVPEGTGMKWELRCSPAIQALEVKIGDETTQAEISEGGTKAVFETTAETTFKYTFHWTEKEHGFTYDDVQHIVRVVPDLVPEVELIEPSGDGFGTLKKTVRLVAKAADDHGLEKAALLYSINGSKEERIKLQELGGTSKDIQHDWVLSKALPQLKEGDKLAFSIEVSDKYPYPPAGSHVNISATRRLAIVSEPEYLDWFKREFDTQRELIVQARDSEKKATAEVAKLKVEEKKD